MSSLEGRKLNFGGPVGKEQSLPSNLKKFFLKGHSCSFLSVRWVKQQQWASSLTNSEVLAAISSGKPYSRVLKIFRSSLAGEIVTSGLLFSISRYCLLYKVNGTAFSNPTINWQRILIGPRVALNQILIQHDTLRKDPRKLCNSGLH